jgi:hypothetical protein
MLRTTGGLKPKFVETEGILFCSEGGAYSINDANSSTEEVIKKCPVI